MATTQFRLATALCAVAVVSTLAKLNEEKEKKEKEEYTSSLKPTQVDVGGVSYEEYNDHVCMGKKYTHEETNLACNGWGGETWQQCVQHCSNNDVPNACKTKHPTCGAAVFYPNPASAKKQGWCHLFTKDECKKTEFWSPLKTFKKAAKTSTQQKWEIMSDKVIVGGASTFSYTAAFAMLGMFAAVIVGVFSRRRTSVPEAVVTELLPSASDAD